MRTQRGFTLIAVIWFAALVLTATLATHGLVGVVRHRLAHHRAELAASSMAVSGADYAQAMLASRRWSSPHSFTSPDLARGGFFQVEIQGGTVRSTGVFGPARVTVVRRLP
ncbi:MAG: hypothetical protein ACOX9B_10855 [Candidatus Xenobium sp.]|jgi:type II secretory pathway pseudopilin PulG|nr:hypothetical protein [Burkholderiales bacterium]